MAFEPGVVTLLEGRTYIGQVHFIDEENVMVKDGMEVSTVGVNKLDKNKLMLAFMPYNLFSADSIFLLKRKDILTIVTPLDAVYDLYLRNLELLKEERVNFGDFGEWLLKQQKESGEKATKEPGDKVIDILSRLGRSPETKH